ncbi:MAG: hypothetical protein H0U82_01110 [Actinobacteria bacterium]|nr:hypothetical protein [Actinomycetota bacterium]
MTVSNDDAGKLTFAIEIPSHQTLPADKEVLVAFDTDRNASTGTARGNEFAVFVETNSIGFYRFDQANGLYNIVPAVPVAGGYSNGAARIEFNRSALGGVSIFDFESTARRADGSTVDDLAPNTGTWTYEVKIGPPVTRKLAIRSLNRQPNPPLPGERFTVSATVVRVGWAGRFNGDGNGNGFCAGRIGGRRVEWSGVVSAGRVSCQFEIPASAAGKRITGSIGATDGGAEVTRLFSARIVAPKVTLTAGGTSLAPRQPEAGRKFYYALTVFVHTGQSEKRLQSGNVECKARVAGRALENFEERILKKEGVRCGWEIPPGTAGRSMIGSIVVRSEGTTLRHPFTRRIR